MIKFDEFKEFFLEVVKEFLLDENVSVWLEEDVYYVVMEWILSLVDYLKYLLEVLSCVRFLVLLFIFLNL